MAVKPNLALIPSGVKASKVYSVLPSDGVGDFDFSRSGSATRINKDGLIETVASNVPRLNYPLIDGVVSGCPSLLLEPVSTNLITYSEDFTDASWLKLRTSVESNNTISPDGTLNASKIVEDTSNGTHILYINNINTGAGKSSLSIYVKSNGRNWVYLYDPENGNGVYFDVQNGLIGTITGTPTSYEIKEVVNGFYRISIVSTSTTRVDYQVYLAENDGVNSYQGDGVSGVYVWGSQLEFNDFPTSYIPSLTGSQTTRSAETCNNSGDANTFNDSEGVLMAEISNISENQTTTVAFSVSDGSTSNAVSVYYFGTSGLYYDIFNSDGTRSGNTPMTKIQQAYNNKISLKYKSGDIALWVNGFEVNTNVGTLSLNGLSELNLDYGSGGFPFYGNTKQIQYFDTALVDTDLEELTSWQSFNEMAESQQYTIE